MTDEEITAVLTSVVALRNKLTLKDFHNICRISVIRERLQRKSLSPKNTTAIFSTIVLLKNKLTPGDIKNLYRVLAAHGQPPICSSCDRPITNFRLFSWDHVFARSIGGPDDIKNMTPMCTTCNVKKGSHIREECLCHVESNMLAQMKVKYNIQPQKTKKQKPVKTQVSVMSNNYTEKKKTRRNHIRMNGWTATCLTFHR